MTQDDPGCSVRIRRGGCRSSWGVAVRAVVHQTLRDGRRDFPEREIDKSASIEDTAGEKNDPAQRTPAAGERAVRQPLGNKERNQARNQHAEDDPAQPKHDASVYARNQGSQLAIVRVQA